MQVLNYLFSVIQPLYELLVILIVILIFNIFNKLYIGDSGSYILGFVYSVLLLNIYHENNYISPYYSTSLVSMLRKFILYYKKV